MSRTAQLIAFVAALSGGCSACSSDDGNDAGDTAFERPGWTTAVSIIDELPSCDIDHRGQLFDMGTAALQGRHGFDIETPPGIVPSEHDGATWARVFDRTISVNLYLPQVTPLFVALRAIGRDASSVTVSLDGQALGTLKLARDEIKVLSTSTTSLPVDAGLHRLTLNFRGGKQRDAHPFVELDWIRLGVPDDLERTYGAPTMADILAPAAQLAGVPHRALSMRAPAAVRCTVRVPEQGRLRAAVGMRGSGDATAAVLVREENQEPAVLHRVDVKGEAAWTDIEVPLQAYAGRVVTIELAAAETTGAGRLLIGDPTIDVPVKPELPTPNARAVLIVLLSGVERRDLPPWRETKTPHLPVLSELARNATVFDGHRASSTLVSAEIASLLSGITPREHGLRDAEARLPASVSTIAGVAREASVRAAMFTGVPTTFEPFGFARDWEHYTQYPPNEGRLASAPLEDAAQWLTGDDAQEGRPTLAVVHVRGGHPPWEVTPTEADKLPPADYAGYLGPRRGAQILAKTQGKHSRLSDADRERLSALFHASLSRQDAALGELFRKLQDSGHWDSTLVIVTADVSSARRTLFVDGLDIDEELLRVPLYIHFPGSLHAATRIETQTETYDVTRTALAALGISPPKGMLGENLGAIARGDSQGTQRMRVAFKDHQYSARWGEFALISTDGERPRLCHLGVDPTCAYDRTDVHPAVAYAMFRHVVAFITARGKPTPREPLELKPDALGWLSVWGSF